MLSRRLPALGALVLLTASCGGPDFDVRAPEPEGAAWFPQVVEFEQDAGAGLSITTDAEGNPHLAYLELSEPLPPGQDPPPPDPLAPVLPAVGHAHWVQDIWTHSEVTHSSGDRALEITADDQTAIAVDGEGTHHMAWTEGGNVMYSDDPTGETEPQVVASAGAEGLSIWADERGTPHVAYYEIPTDPEGPTQLVRMATLTGRRWSVETVAEAEGSEPLGTGGVSGPDGPIVAYGSATGTSITRRQGSIWRSEVVDPDGGIGVSMDQDADGNPHLAYLTDEGQVRHAHSIGGGPWEISDVGAAVAQAGTSIAVDDAGTHHIAWQRDVGLAYATNAGGEFAELPLPDAAAGGQRPRVAAGAAGAHLAWYSPEGTRLIMATFTEDEPLLAVPSPSEAPGGGPATECEPEGDALAIVAEGLEFDVDCLASEAGQPFTIEFDNSDAGIPHNVAIYTAEPPDGEDLFIGETFPGPETRTYDVEPIEESGDFYFQCDVHPTMNGTFVVAGS